MDVNSFVIGLKAGKASVPPGLDLNLHYNKTTPPEDTSKLWVKTIRPNGVVVGKTKHGEILTEKMENAHCESGSTKIGTKIYAFGGKGANEAPTNLVTIFDTESKSVEELETMPFSRIGMGVASRGSKIYLFGGNDNTGKSSKEIYIFDTVTQKYERVTKDADIGVSGMACEIAGNKVYLFGGYNGNINSPSKAIYSFDVDTKDFQTLTASLNSTAAYPASVAVGNKIYIFGGVYNVNNQARVTSYCFDTDTETIVRIANLPVAFGCAGCVEINGYIYIIGGIGYSNGNLYLDTVYRYDIDKDEYEKMKITISQPKGYMFCDKEGDNIYLIGGKLLKTNSYKNTDIELLTIGPMVKERFIHIETEDGATEEPIITSDALTIKVPISNVFWGESNNLGKSVDAAVYKNGAWTNI